MKGCCRSCAALGRSFGFFLRQTSTKSTNSSEKSPSSSGGGSSGTENKTCMGCKSCFGGTPFASSMAVIPNDQISICHEIMNQMKGSTARKSLIFQMYRKSLWVLLNDLWCHPERGSCKGALGCNRLVNLCCHPKIRELDITIRSDEEISSCKKEIIPLGLKRQIKGQAAAKGGGGTFNVAVHFLGGVQVVKSKESLLENHPVVKKEREQELGDFTSLSMNERQGTDLIWSSFGSLALSRSWQDPPPMNSIEIHNSVPLTYDPKYSTIY